MPLVRLPEPFDHPRLDLRGQARRVPRPRARQRASLRTAIPQRPHLQAWPQLCEELAHAVRAHKAIIDGEILDRSGRSNFKSLLFRREWPFFYVFDLLAVDGEDLREWPLLERKRRLRRLIPSVPTRLLYVDHIQARGSDFFEVACAHDLEGIVAKPANGRYHSDGISTNWIKIKNAGYTQMTGRQLFERRTDRRAKRIPGLRMR
jgi:ATP-dependent DNA ligase